MNNWSIRQLDINNVFLNGIFTKEAFMHRFLYFSKVSQLQSLILHFLFFIKQIIDSNVQLIENVIHYLSYQFALKDLAEFNYFFYLEVTPSIKGLHLSQTKYTGDILKGCQTPMSSSERLVNDKGVSFILPSIRV